MGRITQDGGAHDYSLRSLDVLTTRKSVSALLAAVVFSLGVPSVAEAAPKNYCAELRGR